MNLNINHVKRIADEVAEQISPSLHVAGVVLTASGSDYVEVLVNILGCSAEPCRIAVGVPRTPPVAVLRELLTTKLREHYEAHRASGTVH